MDGLYEGYADRVRKFGVRWETASVAEVPAGGRYTVEHATEREARDLTARLERGAVIALDRKGTSWTSEQIASRFEAWATPCAQFVLGGPCGLHRSALERADHVWSLGAPTLPHELARVVVAEQLFRAMTILRGVPYHR